MEHQRLHSTRAFISWTSSCRVTSCQAGLQEHRPDLPGDTGGRAFGHPHSVEGKERGLSKEQPVLSGPTVLLHWACTKHPGENHAKSHPEALANSFEMLRSVSELFLTCTSFTLKKRLKAGLTGTLSPTNHSASRQNTSTE